MPLPKFSDKIYEFEVAEVKVEFITDYERVWKQWHERHPEWPLVAWWWVDQGGPTRYIALYEFRTYI